MTYDAILRDWQQFRDGGVSVVIGTIYEDKKKRFEDGARVRTSYVVSLDEDTGILKTRNTTYKLENKRGE